MKTQIINLRNYLTLNEGEIQKLIEKAIEELQKGNIVAFPTETVYGLGANALNEISVRKIFEIKGRPSDNPLIVHISSISDVEKLIDIRKNENYKKILDRLQKAIKYWPGPISFIFPANKKFIPEATRGNLSTVAIRFPDNKIAQILIKLSGFPIAAPSANISGKPSGTRAEDVYNDFSEKIKYIIDGGDSVYGIESTVIDLSSDVPIILRPGFITKEDLIKDFPDLIIHSKKIGIENNPKSPGMKYTHYKPDAKVIILSDVSDLEKYDDIFNFNNFFNNKIFKFSELPVQFFQNNKFLVLSDSTPINFPEKSITFVYNFQNSYNLARNMYSKFREADNKKLQYILVRPLIKDNGIELAIMNRLIKAAEEIWIL